MCLGAQARAQNESARRQYQYQIDQREREWMQQLAVYNAKKVQYDINLNNAQLGAQEAYAQNEQKRQQALGDAEMKYQEMYADLLSNSKAAQAFASGQTGRSIARAQILERGEYGRKVAEIGRQLRTNQLALAQENAKATGQLKGYMDQQFAQVAFNPVPDVEPPVPVMQSVGAAAFMDALSIGTSLLSIPGKGGGSLLLGLGG